jgi:long-chain acyl-CoA synthetase
VVSSPSAGISDLLRAAARESPSSPALVDGARRLTWAEFDALVTRAALAMIATGARPGDRVSLTLPTGADFAVAYVGALRAGLVAVPIDPAYTDREAEEIRADSGSSLHLSADGVRGLLDTAPDGPDPRCDRGGEAISVLLYTSGVSGRPKGAMLSARALLANLDQLAAVDPPLLGREDVLFLPLPLSHVFGLNAGLGSAIRVGATTVLAGRFDPPATLDRMAAEHATVVLGVPGQFAAWLRSPGAAAGFASVRLAMSGSATLPHSVVEGFARLGVALHDGYGLTEAAPVVTVTALGAGHDRPRAGSVGRPLPGVEVQLRDADGDALGADGAGDPGRIFVRGANLFSGYWPLGDDGPDEDGWFGTGDIAVIDDAGDLHLVGRTTDLIVVNGFNVYPVEVETVLAAAPGVAEVAVVGVRSESAGEALRAYVVPADGASLDPEDLRAVAARSLARFKLPESIEVVAALPRTVTGKIMKWLLPHDGPDDDRG